MSTDDQSPDQHRAATEPPDADDVKAKMRAALDRKQGNESGVPQAGPTRAKAHGSEVIGGGPRIHRRKAGGGGS